MHKNKLNEIKLYFRKKTSKRKNEKNFHNELKEVEIVATALHSFKYF